MMNNLYKWIGFCGLLLGLSISASADPHAFPVPYVDNLHANQGINFTDLPASGTIKILTATGEEINKLDIPPGTGIKQWRPVTTSSNKPVATGVYLFLVDGDGKQTTGKIVVIR
jgi:hypothetical protein